MAHNESDWTWYDSRISAILILIVLAEGFVISWLIQGDAKVLFESAISNRDATSLIFSGIVALSTVVYAMLTWRLVAETKAMRQAQSSPAVSIFLDMPRNEVNLVDIVVRNDGPAAAKNLRFTWDGEVPRFGDQELKDIQFLSEGLKFLGPGREHGTLLTSFGNLPESLWELKIPVRVEYESMDGRPFGDEFTLDFGQYQGFSVVSSENENIGRHLKEISKNVGYLISGSRKPRIIVQSLESFRVEQQNRAAEAKKLKNRLLKKKDEEE